MDSYYLRNSLLATEITSLQQTKLQSAHNRDDWIFCLYKWLILSLLLAVQNSLLEGQGYDCAWSTFILGTLSHRKGNSKWRRIRLTDLAPKSSFAVTQLWTLTQTFQVNGLGLAMSLLCHWGSHTKLISFQQFQQFFSSLWFLWFPVPVCLKKSEKVTKCKSFGGWMCGESQTASPVKSNPDQAQREDERLSWGNKLKVHEV